MKGLKHDQGKLRFDLLPPLAMEELSKVLTFGAEKYEPNSWQAVDGAIERYEAALLRHLFEIKKGNHTDPESGLHHISHVLCNAAFLAELHVKGS